MVKRSDMREILGLALIPTLLMVALPSIYLYYFGGVDSSANFSKFLYYGILGYSAVIAGAFVRLLKSEGFFARNEDLYAFSRMTAHSPRNTYLVRTLEDLGGVGKGVARAIKSPGTFLIVWTILGLIFGMSVMYSGTFVSGAPQLYEGQVQTTAELGLSVDPAAISETLFIFMFMFYTIVGGVGWVAMNRLGLNKFWAIVLGKIVAVPSTTVFNTAHHVFRYGVEEAAILNITMQGFMYSSTVAMFDSIIPAYMIHAFGNLFNKAAELFTSEALLVATVVIAFFALLLLTWLVNPFNVLGDN